MDHWASKALPQAWNAWCGYQQRRLVAKAAAQRALQHWSMLSVARVRPGPSGACACSQLSAAAAGGPPPL